MFKCSNCGAAVLIPAAQHSQTAPTPHDGKVRCDKCEEERLDKNEIAVDPQLKYWIDLVSRNREEWQMDSIHNKNNDMLLYIPSIENRQAGKFITIITEEKFATPRHICGILQFGHYEYAVSNIGDAAFTVKHRRQFDTCEEATAWLIRNTGIEL